MDKKSKVLTQKAIDDGVAHAITYVADIEHKLEIAVRGLKNIREHPYLDSDVYRIIIECLKDLGVE